MKSQAVILLVTRRCADAQTRNDFGSFPWRKLGDVLSPLVIEILTDRFSMRTAFLLTGLMFIVSGFTWLVGMRHLQRDTELAPTRL